MKVHNAHIPAAQAVDLGGEDTQPLSSDDEAGISITDRRAKYLTLDRLDFIAFIKWNWQDFCPDLHPFLTSEQWIDRIPYERVEAYYEKIAVKD